MISFAAAVAVALAIAAPSRAERASGVKEQGGVSYMTGGVGTDERARMESMAGEFNLRVEVASPTGAYVGTPRIEIRDAAGKTKLDAVANGPLLYAKLPPGSYTVSVHEQGRKPAQKSVQVGAQGAAQVTMHVAGAEDAVEKHTSAAAGRERGMD
jgi:hypothetical protein